MNRWGAFCLQRCGDCLNKDCDPIDGTCLQGCRISGYLYSMRCSNEGGSMTPSQEEAKNLPTLEKFWYQMRKGSVKEWSATCSGLQRWGMFCMFKCSANCLLGCDLETGNCKRGVCTKGYKGARCEDIDEILQYQKAYAAESSTYDVEIPAFTVAFVILAAFGIAALCFVVQKDRPLTKKQIQQKMRRLVRRRIVQRSPLDGSKSNKNRNSTDCAGEKIDNKQDHQSHQPKSIKKSIFQDPIARACDIFKPAALPTTTNINQMMRELKEKRFPMEEYEAYI